MNEQTNHRVRIDPEAGPDLEGKLTRISGHARGLMEELRGWVDLKIQRAVAGVREEVEAKGKQVALDVLAGVVALAGLQFILVALALGVSVWVGPIWGFLIVGGVLFGGAALLFALNHRKRGRRSIPIEGVRETSDVGRITLPELERHEDGTA
ncbi:MAG: phage holin family protein [Rhodothermales bacterium]|nr:phage holin family protein [Rhodothermales bacterium]